MAWQERETSAETIDSRTAFLFWWPRLRLNIQAVNERLVSLLDNRGPTTPGRKAGLFDYRLRRSMLSPVC